VTGIGGRRPSAAMVVALLALFIALGGTATAAVVAKARFALNAGKLQGKTAAQVAAMAGGPNVTLVPKEFRIPPEGQLQVDVPCPAGARAIGGAWAVDLNGIATPLQNAPLSASVWRFDLRNLRGDGPAVGTAYAVCLR
jgi:hypothetical protein